MLRKNPRPDRQDDLFRSRLENIINPRHELVKLGALIDWDGLEADLSRFYCSDNGRPAGSIRLMTGLCFLKDIKGLSDEDVCAVWCENPYFQARTTSCLNYVFTLDAIICSPIRHDMRL